MRAYSVRRSGRLHIIPTTRAVRSPDCRSKVPSRSLAGAGVLAGINLSKGHQGPDKRRARPRRSFQLRHYYKITAGPKEWRHAGIPMSAIHGPPWGDFWTHDIAAASACRPDTSLGTAQCWQLRCVPRTMREIRCEEINPRRSREPCAATKARFRGGRFPLSPARHADRCFGVLPCSALCGALPVPTECVQARPTSGSPRK